MAIQEGIIKFTGALGDLCFYKSDDGYIGRRKSGISGKRLKEDPVFVRARENGAEFARAGKAVRIIRTVFGPQLRRFADRRMTGRLIRSLMRVVQADPINRRGLRSVIDGDVRLLEGFEFNASCRLRQSLLTPLTSTFNRVTGSVMISIDSFFAVEFIRFPSGATHCKIIAVTAEIDFNGGSHVTSSSESDRISLTSQSQSITFHQSVTPGSVHSIFVAVGIVFYQQVNAQRYALANRSHNAFAFAKVYPRLVGSFS